MNNDQPTLANAQPQNPTVQDVNLPKIPQQLKLPLDTVTQAILLDLFKPLLATLYPVGSIWVAEHATNPATLLGFGTWATYAAGRTMVGIDISDPDFDNPGDTFGEKTHALTSGENGPHVHANSKFQNIGGGANFGFAAGGFVESADTPSSGSGTPHNNVQPSIAVYMWKRTA